MGLGVFVLSSVSVLDVFCICVSHERSHVLTLILWAVARSLSLSRGFSLVSCSRAVSVRWAPVRCSCLMFRGSSLVEAPCSISLFQFTFSSTCEECLCFGCCSLEPHLAASARLLALLHPRGQALLLSCLAATCIIRCTSPCMCHDTVAHVNATSAPQPPQPPRPDLLRGCRWRQSRRTWLLWCLHCRRSSWCRRLHKTPLSPSSSRAVSPRSSVTRRRRSSR